MPVKILEYTWIFDAFLLQYSSAANIFKTAYLANLYFIFCFASRLHQENMLPMRLFSKEKKLQKLFYFIFQSRELEGRRHYRSASGCRRLRTYLPTHLPNVIVIQKVLSGKCFQQQLTAVIGTNTALSLHLVCVKKKDKSWSVYSANNLFLWIENGWNQFQR